jgi:carbon storage regulator CsrA
MLILSRKSCQSVVVGDPAGRLEQMLKVTVLEIGKGTVRLGFEISGDVPVHRWEVMQRIRSSIRSADQASTDRQDYSESRNRRQPCQSSTNDFDRVDNQLNPVH